jgi:hypothetical protein
MAKKATFSPKACLTQLYTPPSSSAQVEDNSAEIRDTGIRKIIAEKVKKKMSDDPNSAVAGKFLILSMAPVISNTNARTDIFSEDHVFINTNSGAL